MPKGDLTQKQHLFVEAFLGKTNRNGTESARIAGYAGTGAALAVMANKLLKNGKVRSRIDKVTNVIDQKVAENVAWGIVELQNFWRAVADDEDNAMRDRLRASELLGKSQAAFTEKVEVSARVESIDRRREAVDLTLSNPQARKAMRSLYAATQDGDNGKSTRH